MPAPPAGESELRRLAGYFRAVDSSLRELTRRAAGGGDRRALATSGLELVEMLRSLDFRIPIYTAYLKAFLAFARQGAADTSSVEHLAAALQQKLNAGLELAGSSFAGAVSQATPDNVDALEPTVAYTDDRGARWALGAFATMQTSTLGRHATSAGARSAVGPGGRVSVDVGECDLCATYAGPAVIGTDPLPPYHPGCTCVVSQIPL